MTIFLCLVIIIRDFSKRCEDVSNSRMLDCSRHCLLIIYNLYPVMSSSHRLVIKDAIWQLIGRIISAAFGFLIIKIMTPYLGPLRYGDYSTILKYFAIWTALADLGLYVLAVKQM